MSQNCFFLRFPVLLFALMLLFCSASSAQANGVEEQKKVRGRQAAEVCTKHGAICDEGLFCKFSTGACKKKVAKGACSVRPDMCMKLYKPVCGCDGKTYGNECMAAAAGVSVKTEGKCAKKKKAKKK